jgi:transcription termination/antitermination protein NusG
MNKEKKERKIEDEKPESEVEGELLSKITGDSQDEEGEWYVAQTYSGYEDQVASSLKKRIESMDMGDKIFDIIVPKEKQIEVKGGKKKVKTKKIFPGYVLVRMLVTEDSWYVVRNTPNVTGLLGFGTVPSSVELDELKNIKSKMDKEQPKFDIDFKIGEQVKIIDGPFKDFEGTIEDIDKDKGKVKVLVDMFGRETPVDLDFLQAKKI